MEAPRTIKRRRSREEPAERRRKDRQRKRRKRGWGAADAPVVDGSSTESEVDGNIEETTRSPHAEDYLFEGALLQGAGQRSSTRVTGEGSRQGIRRETPETASSALGSELDLRGSTEQEEGMAQNAAAYSEGKAHGNPEAYSESQTLYADFSGGESDTPREEDSGSEGGHEEADQAGEDHGNTDESAGQINNGPDTGSDEGGGRGAPRGENDERRENQRNPPGFYENYYNPTERLAMALAGVRGSSEISDSAINKMLKVALEHREALESVGQGRSQKKLYTQKLRPRALRHIPRVFTAILLEEKVQGGLAYRRLEDLGAIPKKYVNLPNRGKIHVIREESYVKLRDIKEHHRKVHRGRGISEEELRNHFENAAISVDGVEEGNKCKTTFHVVTLRLGSCIYLYKIFNPLVGHRVASPSVQEVLG